MTIACLAIEASTERLSLAACAGDRRVEVSFMPAKAESARLYWHAERLLGEIGLRLADLQCVAFGCGPGSFTGVRLAATAAQALGYGLGIPVCRRSSLAVLAAGALRQSGAARVIAFVDARMGRAYLGIYAPAGDGDVVALQPDSLVVPDGVILPAGLPAIAAGSGWAQWPSLAEGYAPGFTAVMADLLPSADDLLGMALADSRAGRLVTAEAALPEYLAHGPVVAQTPVQYPHQES